MPPGKTGSGGIKSRDGKKAEPVYVSNGAFAGVTTVFVLVAAWGQATRAGKNSRSMLEMQEEVNHTVGSSLRKKQIEMASLTRVREGRLVHQATRRLGPRPTMQSWSPLSN